METKIKKDMELEGKIVVTFFVMLLVALVFVLGVMVGSN